MQPITWQIYYAAGAPQTLGDLAGICRACGTEGAGLNFHAWVRDTFTDHDKLMPGEIVCHACQFCFTDRNEALTALTGKDKPQRMRNYSHFVVDGRWYPLSKGEKSRMKELLFARPSVAVIAESGQKHILFRARPGFWQFEEQSLLACPDALKEILDAVELLYKAGASKGEIETGRYSQKTIRQIGIGAWQQMDAPVRAFRGGLPLKLALFLAQKESQDGSPDDSQ